MSKADAARKRFSAAVTAEGNNTEAAFKLGISPAMVSYIRNGEKDPGLETAFRIQEIYGIPMQDWVEDQKTETVKRFAR